MLFIATYQKYSRFMMHISGSCFYLKLVTAALIARTSVKVKFFLLLDTDVDFTTLIIIILDGDTRHVLSFTSPVRKY